MSVRCDWCGDPIYGSDPGERWGMSVQMRPFNSLDLGNVPVGTDSPIGIGTEFHVHSVGCTIALVEAIRDAISSSGLTEVERDSLREERQSTTSQPPQSKSDEAAKRREEWNERWNLWKELPSHEKERMILEAVGDGSLTNAEIEKKIEAGPGRPLVSATNIQSITKSLFEAGELEREIGQWGKSRLRYKRAPLKGEIAKLQEQFDDKKRP